MIETTQDGYIVVTKSDIKTGLGIEPLYTSREVDCNSPFMGRIYILLKAYDKLSFNIKPFKDLHPELFTGLAKTNCTRN